jgi:hypothetical protein
MSEMSYGIRCGAVIILPPLHLPCDLLCHLVPAIACIIAWPPHGQPVAMGDSLEVHYRPLVVRMMEGRAICVHIRPFVSRLHGEDE